MLRTKKTNKKKTKRSKRKMKPIQSVKGMTDILPSDQFVWDYVLNTSEKLCQDFGFGKIETPILEHTLLYKRGLGEITDIVEKEMFSFKTKGGDNVSLRPEGTAGVVRAYIENGMNKYAQPVKLYYEGPMFRYENPQADRHREHHQFGFEIIGERHPVVDAQAIYLAWKIFKRIGIKNIAIQINSIGCRECRPNYKRLLIDYCEMKANKLCVDCRKRLIKNPLRILDCKEYKCVQTASCAPQIIDNLCKECHDHFKSILEFLDELELPYFLNSNLVRGIDYYTKTVFEIWEDNAEQKARQSSLGGGGRYDCLVGQLGGEDVPAVGFSFGVERIIKRIPKQSAGLLSNAKKQVFLVQLGNAAKKKALKLLDKLIDNNISVGESVGRKSIKSQLRMANKFNAKLALIIGQKEALDETVIIRDIKGGMQEIVSMDKIIKEVKKRLKNS